MKKGLSFYNRSCSFYFTNDVSKDYLYIYLYHTTFNPDDGKEAIYHFLNSVSLFITSIIVNTEKQVIISFFNYSCFLIQKHEINFDFEHFVGSQVPGIMCRISHLLYSWIYNSSCRDQKMMHTSSSRILHIRSWCSTGKAREDILRP